MKYNNDCYNELINLVEYCNAKGRDWEAILKQKPYSLKSIKKCFYNPNWYMLVYNLFESKLTDPIVKACRGSVIDISDENNVKVICAPYLKFCNLGEFPEEDKKIDWDSVWISEKIDGILIKAAKYNGKFYWFTNGSFDLNAPLMSCSDRYSESETDDCKTFFDLLYYALNKIGDCEYKTIYDSEEDAKGLATYGGWCDNFEDGTTLCFELVSPKNKIICDYPETKLWLHGYRDANLNEIRANTVKGLNISVPKTFNLKHPTAEAVKIITDSFDGSEEEGVVICDKEWHRAKIKSDSYLKLKFMRDVNSISDKNIYKYILADEIDDVICEGNKNNVEAVKNKIKEFEEMYNYFSAYALKLFNNLGNNRKIFSSIVKETFGDLSSLAFRAIDKKNFNTLKKVYYNYNKFEKDFYKLKSFLIIKGEAGEL